MASKNRGVYGLCILALCLVALAVILEFTQRQPEGFKIPHSRGVVHAHNP